jgi:hypothetical protein
MQRILLVAVLGSSVVLAQSAGVGNKRMEASVLQAGSTVCNYSGAAMPTSAASATQLAYYANSGSVLAHTVSTLPACNSTTKDTDGGVSDAASPAYLGTLTGGGSTFTPVVCNGTAWVSY